MRELACCCGFSGKPELKLGFLGVGHKLAAPLNSALAASVRWSLHDVLLSEAGRRRHPEFTFES